MAWSPPGQRWPGTGLLPTTALEATSFEIPFSLSSPELLIRRQVFTPFLFALVALSLVSAPTSAQDSFMNEYIKAFEGRWVCDATAAQDIDGYWKKGEAIRNELVYTAQVDRSGMQYELNFTKGGKVLPGVRGICTWDAANQAIKNYGFAVPGFHIELKVTKEGEAWISEGHLTHPDGEVSRSKVAIHFSDDGNTQTSTLLEGMDKHGEQMEEYKRTWKKISKNQEVLEKELGWIVGVWESEVDFPGLGSVPIETTYQWVADKHIIQLDMTIGDWKGLSMIFYDPADGRIKMWGANSEGGNGQAVLAINGDELVWTNTVYEGDGGKRVSEFTYVKQPDPETFVVKFWDAVDNTQKQVTATKRD